MRCATTVACIVFLSFLTALNCPPSAAYIKKGSFTLTIGSPFKTMGVNIKASSPMITFLGERKINRIGINFFISLGEFKGYHEEQIVNVYHVTPRNGDLIMPGLRVNYYPIQQDRFDVYGGLMLSYFMCTNGLYLSAKSATGNNLGTRGDKLASEYMGAKVGFQIGAHYWINQWFGIVAEIGYGVATFNAGLVIGK